MDKSPCLDKVYVLIRKQKNKIKKYSVLDDKGFGGNQAKRDMQRQRKPKPTHRSPPDGERNKGETPGREGKKGG